MWYVYTTFRLSNHLLMVSGCLYLLTKHIYTKCPEWADHGETKLISNCQRLESEGARGKWGWEVTSRRHKVFFRGNENVLQLDYGAFMGNIYIYIYFSY